MPVNAKILRPTPPGPWVDSIECECGCKYDMVKFGICWDDGVALVRSMNGEDGGFRTRGPVLWAMRTLKLSMWYAAHEHCGDEVPF